MSILKTFKVFSKECEELVCLTTGDIANKVITKDMLDITTIGKHAIRTFVTERLFEKKSVCIQVYPNRNWKHLHHCLLSRVQETSRGKVVLP